MIFKINKEVIRIDFVTLIRNYRRMVDRNAGNISLHLKIILKKRHKERKNTKCLFVNVIVDTNSVGVRLESYGYMTFLVFAKENIFRKAPYSTHLVSSVGAIIGMIR